MTSSTPLSGLKRLMAACQRHSLPLRLSPPLDSAPKHGELFLGEPFDAHLAAVYQRLGGAELGPLTLYRPDTEWNGLLPWNEALREDATAVHFHSAHVFGRETGFALYFGTVPKLADSRGLQPVVHIPAHDGEQFAIPIASSVDRFFDLYSRYLERMVVDPEYLETGISLVTFPWHMGDLIRRDEPLIAQVRAGRFDFLAYDYAGAHKWLRELSAPPSSPL